jgi:hypothetical protein
MSIISSSTTMKPIGESYIMANNQTTNVTKLSNPEYLKEREEAKNSTWNNFTQKYYDAKNKEGEYADENAERLAISQELEEALDEGKKANEVKAKLEKGEQIPSDLRKDVDVAKIKTEVENAKLQESIEVSKDYNIQKALEVTTESKQEV